MKKYELYKKCETTGFYYIKALRDIPMFGVKVGDIGGRIASEANLSQDGNAWVYCNAIVSGDAWVYCNAQVYDNARVYDNSRVYGNAQVYCNAQVYGNAQVYDNSRVYGNAVVSGNAQVYDNAWVYGDARVYGNAIVSGDAEVCDNSRVYDNARVKSIIGCQYLHLKPFPITITSHVQVGCQQFTYEEFYGINEEHAQAEGYKPGEWTKVQEVVLPIMKYIENINK